jgi:enoyl-CoA hydratase
VNARWETSSPIEGVILARFINDPTGYFTGEAGEELRRLVRRWRDDAVRAVVLAGDGQGRFITHFAVEEIVELARRPARAASLGPAPAERFQDVLQDLSDLEKPVIAAMTGDTMGGGLELALACDLRIAQDGDFRIGFPEAALGILAGGGGTQRLPRLIGVARALDVLMRSRVMTPDAALQMGIVSEVSVDPVDRALAIATRLLQAPAAALAQTKRAVLRGAELPLAAGLRLEAEAWLATITAGTAAGPMEEFLAVPFERRREWIVAHGAA